MARIDDCTVFQCDRCKTIKWYPPTDEDGMKEWYSTTRYDANNAGHEYLFCLNCWQEYLNKLKDADNAFDSWMQNAGVRS
ncbi:hypothetical protein [Bifidobacterium platyrrhinorum]|uniref:Uncharacterized protein n=1 Tax=Bifidobacterium platyrrhinorum TaxID=2661628 RepID=A0A6L9SU37_9BIFI|nr:hypothetical protein [Bifidobacterium platyrrhinorum]NEG56127.1 hypothetical protein [Bifidobacterium platyrrhinorum]